MPTLTRKRTRWTSPTWTNDPRDESVAVRLKHRANEGTFPRELLVAGPAGTGKTLPILQFFHLLQRRYGGLRGLFLRATRKALTESVLVTFEQEVLPSDSMDHLAASCGRSHRHSYDYPNGSTIVCSGLDLNPERVLSTAWDWIYCNEAIEIKQSVWETLASRLGRPGRDRRFGWLLGDTNPADPQHWLKVRCDEGRCELWETTHRANPSMWDGEDWTPAGARYLDGLGNVTGVRRKRLVLGLWVAGEGAWFDTYDPDVHVKPVEFDRNLPLYVSIDSGVHTGAVIFQLVEGMTKIHVLADSWAEGKAASVVGREVHALSQQIAPGCYHRVVSTDSAGDARQAGGGPIITGEYIREGLCNSNRDLIRWPKFPGCVSDGLYLVEAFVGGTEDTPPAMAINPRAKHVQSAFANYKRAIKGGVKQDYPIELQHPASEFIDCLRGALMVALPEGRKPQPNFNRLPAGKVF